MNHFVLPVENPPIPDFKSQAKALQTKAPQTFDMTQAVPSFPTFSRIREELKKDLENPEMSFYTDVPGLLELRQAIVARHPLQKKLDVKNILITAGANHAAYTALTLLFSPGDGVLLPEPFYFNHDMALKMLALKPQYSSLDAEAGFQLQAESLITELQKTKSRGVLLVTPNNPSGAFYSSAEILKLLLWTSANKVEVILDETYIHYDAQHLNQVEIGTFIGKGLTLVGSFSKSFSLTGYRVGYMISGQEEINQSLKIQDTMVICAPTLSQRAALHGLELCQSDLQKKVSELRDLTVLLRKKSAEWKNFRLRSSGAFFAFIEHPYALNATQAALKLYEEAGILALPGTVFGKSQNKFLRLAYANFDAAKLTLALDQLSALDRRM